jgi:hypothetical protein
MFLQEHKSMTIVAVQIRHDSQVSENKEVAGRRKGSMRQVKATVVMPSLRKPRRLGQPGLG